MSTNEMSPALEQAFELYQQGEHLKAEDCLRAAAGQAESDYGPGSPEYAGAQYELAAMLQLMGRLDEGIVAMRRACEVSIPDDHQATRDRLTYMMQLGEMLTSAGEFDEAESILRRALDYREAFYGRDHAGFAFGLEPLADVMLRKGDPSTALAMVDEVIDNFWRNGHPRVATAFPLRAAILAAMNDPTPTFAGLAELPDQILIDMVNQAINATSSHPPEIGQAVLTEMLPMISTRFGSDHQSTLQIQATLANLGRELGGHEGRIESIEKVVAALESRGDHDQAIDARYGLALALSDAGNDEAALEVYQQAIADAEKLGHEGLRIQGLRNMGLLYSEIERRAEAEQTLRLAAGAARKTGDPQQIGRCLIALGIFLQHGGDLEQAEPLLAEAVELVDPAHPDSLCGRSHLQAIRENSSCGCGDMSDAVAEAFRSYVMQRLPDGLLEDLQVELGEEGFNVSVNMAREPSEEELDLLSRTISQAKADFQKRMQDGDR